MQINVASLRENLTLKDFQCAIIHIHQRLFTLACCLHLLQQKIRAL